MASGFSRDGYLDLVCAVCVDDPSLAEFVSEHDRIGKCTFCATSDVPVVFVDDLFHLMSACLQTEWEDPLDSAPWEGGYQGVLLVDSDELLELEGEPLGNKDLREEFVSAFFHEWCAVPYRQDRAETLLESWHWFCHLTKTRKRYLLDRPRLDRDQGLDSLIEPHRVLDTIGRIIVESGRRVLRHTVDVRIVRGRPHHPSKICHTVAELGPPPSKAATHHRMSGAGVSVFYGAETVQTVKRELKGEKDRALTSAIWTPNRPLLYLDLLAAVPIPSVFDRAARRERTVFRFLDAFARHLSRSLDEEQAVTEYIPSQIATEYIRDHLLDGGVDAIRYPSAADKPHGVCWVVFVDQRDCLGLDPLITMGQHSIKRFEPGEW